MPYVALRPCRFSGKAFFVGEGIPGDIVQPSAAKNLIKASVIAPVSDGEQDAKTEPSVPERTGITVSVNTEQGVMHLEITQDGLQSVFDVLTGKVIEAEDIVRSMTDVNALILLDLSDSRRTIREAVKARGRSLSGTEEAGES